jgi:hypothetical protein
VTAAAIAQQDALAETGGAQAITLILSDHFKFWIDYSGLLSYFMFLFIDL